MRSLLVLAVVLFSLFYGEPVSSQGGATIDVSYVESGTPGIYYPLTICIHLTQHVDTLYVRFDFTKPADQSGTINLYDQYWNWVDSKSVPAGPDSGHVLFVWEYQRDNGCHCTDISFYGDITGCGYDTATGYCGHGTTGCSCP